MPAVKIADDDFRRATKFLKEYFSGTEHAIELRAIEPGSPVIPGFIANAEECRFFIQRHKAKNIYFGACTRNGGGTAECVQEIPGLWVDIDFKVSPEAEAVKAVESFPLAPTFLVRSGGGIHLYWKFKEPALAKEYNPTPALKGLCRILGGDYACTDIARIMRLPYTWNVKYTPPVQCVVDRYVAGNQYNPSDFAQYETDEAPEASRSPDKKPPIEDTFRQCVFLAHCADDAATLPEPQWWAMVSNLCRAPGGVELIHRLSLPHPGYSRKETDKKILNTINGSAPISCRKIHEEFGFSCGPCPNASSPAILLRIPAAPVPTAAEEGIVVQEERNKEEIAAFPERLVYPTRGFLAEYIDCFSEVTDAPDIYHLMMGYFTLGVILKDRVYIRLAGDQMYPNIWTVLIGGSSLFRKTTSLNKSRGLVLKYDPKMALPSDFTTEALLDILAATPQGAFYHPEFRALYGMLSKDYMSGAKALLTDLYDSPPEYKRETKGKTAHIKQPIISMCSATTTEWLTGKDTASDFGSGFLARFLFVPAFTRKQSLPFPPDPDVKKYALLLSRMRSIEAQYSLCGLPREAKYDAAARADYIEWHTEYDRLDPFGGTPLAPFHARYQSYVHKLAILYTVSVGGNVEAMDLEAMTYATKTINEVTKRLCHLYDKYLSFNRDDEKMRALYRIVPDKEAITRSDLLRRSHLTSKQFTEYVKTMVETGEIEERPVVHRGQRTTVYRRGGGK
jgi:hypothetical protein